MQPVNYDLSVSRTNSPVQNPTSHLCPTSNLYHAAESDSLILVVQKDSVEYYPAFPLPTEYWSRPLVLKYTNSTTYWLIGFEHPKVAIAHSMMDLQQHIL